MEERSDEEMVREGEKSVGREEWVEAREGERGELG